MRRLPRLRVRQAHPDPFPRVDFHEPGVALKNSLLDHRGRTWRFLGYDAMLSENLVPRRVLGIALAVRFWGVRATYHSVSAFGSSIGTAIRWSVGAAMVCLKGSLRNRKIKSRKHSLTRQANELIQSDVYKASAFSEALQLPVRR